MCGMFTLRTPSETLSALFDDLRFPNLPPRYNIAPTQDVLRTLAGHNVLGGYDLAVAYFIS